MNAIDRLLGTAALLRHGARPALVCGEQTLTYAELAARVGRASAALRTLGIEPGDRVLLLARDTPEYVVAWLGVIHCGAVAIGLNTKLSEEDYRHIRVDSAARLAIIEDVFVDARPDLAAELAREDCLAVAGDRVRPGLRSWRAALAEARADAPAFDAPPDHPMVLGSPVHAIRWAPDGSAIYADIVHDGQSGIYRWRLPRRGDAKPLPVATR